MTAHQATTAQVELGSTGSLAPKAPTATSSISSGSVYCTSILIQEMSYFAENQQNNSYRNNINSLQGVNSDGLNQVWCGVVWCGVVWGVCVN